MRRLNTHSPQHTQKTHTPDLQELGVAAGAAVHLHAPRRKRARQPALLARGAAAAAPVSTAITAVATAAALLLLLLLLHHLAAHVPQVWAHDGEREGAGHVVELVVDDHGHPVLLLLPRLGAAVHDGGPLQRLGHVVV